MKIEWLVATINVQAAGVPPSAGLEPWRPHQEAHDAPWFDAQGSNTGPGLVTPEGAPMGQSFWVVSNIFRPIKATFVVGQPLSDLGMLL